MEIQFPHFNSLLVTKRDGQLGFKGLQNYETRNESTAKCIAEADRIYNFKDFDWFLVNTDDKDLGNNYQGLKMFSYSTGNDDYSHVCPDWTFDNWSQVQIGDYEETVQQISMIGQLRPMTDLMGWRGAMTHPNRHHLLRFTDKSKYDIEEIQWDRSDPGKLTCTNYVSLIDTVKKWRYLIDVEGNGFSARVKPFLFSKRVLFLQDRPYKEWYYPDLKPWVHYVPVKWDLSDLDENLDKIRNDTQLEDEIRFNAHEFAQNNLRREHALKRWNDLIQTL